MAENVNAGVTNTLRYSKEEWIAHKKQEREDVYSTAAEMTTEVSKDPEKYKSFLDVESRFGRYSITNALLVTAQMPDATRLRDYDAWKEAGTPVKKDARGISILEPGDKYTGRDGKEHESFAIKKVFDISQTSAVPQKVPAVDQSKIIRALIFKLPFKLCVHDVCSQPDKIAFYNPESREIDVKENEDTADIFRGLSKKIAHAELAVGKDQYDRSEEDFKAGAVSYILCKRCGIEPERSGISLPISLVGAERAAITAALNDIRNTANNISTRMNEYLNPERAQKERELVLER